MANSSLLSCFALVVILLVNLSGAQYEQCGTDELVLLKALFQTGDNLYRMGRAFFEARDETSRFIRVTYTFINTTTEIEDCDVTFKWALGGFLLVQPPSIFKFTSLLFSTPANDLEPENLNLKLPLECKVLASDKDGNCTCSKDRRGILNDESYNVTILDRLTQQVT